MKELYDELTKSGITPNAFYILWCIYNKEKPSLQKINLELRSLVAGGYLHMDYAVSIKGIALLALGESQPMAPQPASDISNNCDKFLNIFPKGKLPSGKPARVNKKNIEESFNWFFKNYTYDWDTILRATFYYIETYEKANYMYMKNSQYFIRKQNTDKSWDSELANYCEIIINGEDEDTSSHFTDNVV